MNEEIANAMGTSSPQTSGPIAMPEKPLSSKILKRKPLRSIIGAVKKINGSTKNGY
jgi:hypothetical protein